MPWPPTHLVTLRGKTFSVDNFRTRSGVHAYLLTHFHSDHTAGLCGPSWTYGPILAHTLTLEFLRLKYKVKKEYLRPLEYGVPCDLSGVLVTAIPANHCLGSAMFFLEDPKTGESVLFTGDFRYDPQSPLCKAWPAFHEKVTRLVCDCTYLDAKYDFLPQQQAISTFVSLARTHFSPGETHVMLQAYSIGKERLMVALAEELHIRFYPSSNFSRGALKATFGEDYDRFFSDNRNCDGSLVSLMGERQILTATDSVFASNPDTKRVLVISATGWAGHFSVRKAGTHVEASNVIVISGPYSEHCNYRELLDFVRLVSPQKLICLQAESSDDNDRIIDKHFSSLLPVRNSLAQFLGLPSLPPRPAPQKSKAAPRTVAGPAVHSGAGAPILELLKLQTPVEPSSSSCEVIDLDSSSQGDTREGPALRIPNKGVTRPNSVAPGQDALSAETVSIDSESAEGDVVVSQLQDASTVSPHAPLDETPPAPEVQASLPPVTAEGIPPRKQYGSETSYSPSSRSRGSTAELAVSSQLAPGPLPQPASCSTQGAIQHSDVPKDQRLPLSEGESHAAPLVSPSPRWVETPGTQQVIPGVQDMPDAPLDSAPSEQGANIAAGPAPVPSHSCTVSFREHCLSQTDVAASSKNSVFESSKSSSLPHLQHGWVQQSLSCYETIVGTQSTRIQSFGD